jgi:hypothetical protein
MIIARQEADPRRNLKVLDEDDSREFFWLEIRTGRNQNTEVSVLLETFGRFSAGSIAEIYVA